jgi:hypothetical protein
MSDIEEFYELAESGRLAEIIAQLGDPVRLPPRMEPYYARNTNLYYFSPALMRVWLPWLGGHGRRHGHGFGKPR